MKTELFRITMAGTLALGLMAATETARAQQPLVVNIPFAFAAGRMALPAGEYRIQKVAYDSSILLIERTDHAAGTVVMSLAAQANAKQAQSKLVFHRYDNRYFLSQIWIAGSVRGRELTKSPQEKEQSSARTTKCRTRSRLLPASSHPSPSSLPERRAATPRESGEAPSGFPFVSSRECIHQIGSH